MPFDAHHLKALQNALDEYFRLTELPGGVRGDVREDAEQEVEAAMKKVNQSVLDRVEELEQIILELRACYKWDREEYQSNHDLVARVEEALKGVRQRSKR